MITILITLSFVLHLILIFWLILLSFRLSQLKETERKYKSLQQEMDELFASYLLEMKEENERFLNMIQKSDKNSNSNQHNSNSNQHFSQTVKKADDHDDINSKNNANIIYKKPRIPNNEPVPKEKKENPKNEYSPPIPATDDSYEQSLISKVLLLQKQGDSIDEIAKKLNKGKTEIELLLKFQQENS